MKANELRIGNLLQGDKFSIARYGMYSDGVTSITGYGIYLLSENDNILDLKPIPLTEEILLKCGFEKSKEIKKNTYGDIFVIKKDLGIGRRHKNGTDYRRGKSLFYYISNEILIDLKYVHQLQNLYFALTGEELIYVV